ncbi:MAG: hypothetical protein AB1815_10205 [Bacillota bacterium]
MLDGHLGARSEERWKSMKFIHIGVRAGQVRETSGLSQKKGADGRNRPRLSRPGEVLSGPVWSKPCEYNMYY